MAYQLSDLVSSVRNRAKDTSFSQSLIKEYLNETQNSVLGHRRYTFMETVDSDTLSVGSNEIELDDEVQVVDWLTLTSAAGVISRPQYLPHRDFYDTDFSIVTSAPAYFTFYGRSIFVSSEADQSYTVNLHYTRRPSQLVNDTDEPEIPEDYREILIRGALAGVEEYRGNFDRAAIHQRKIEDLSEDMGLRYGLRQLITAPKQTRRSFRRASL